MKKKNDDKSEEEKLTNLLCKARLVEEIYAKRVSSGPGCDPVWVFIIAKHFYCKSCFMSDIYPNMEKKAIEFKKNVQIIN